MGRRKIGSLFHQINKHINKNLNKIGQSKHEAKIEYRQQCKAKGIRWNPAQAEGIHSIKTMEAYKQTANEFSRWIKNIYPEIRRMDQIEKAHTIQYLQERQDQGKSAWTLSKDMSAFNKLFNQGLTKKECGLKQRSYKATERSRVARSHDKSYNPENYRQQIDVASSFGLRRESIYGGQYQIKDVSLFRYDDKIYAAVIEKGGRYREAPCLTSMQSTIEKHFPLIPERDPLTKEQFQALYMNSDHHLFDRYTLKVDNHAFRHEYARNLYEELKQQVQNPVEVKLYSGYDSNTLKKVSEALGHSRLSVVVEHYLR